MTSVPHASGCLWTLITLVLISYWNMPIIDSFDVHYSKQFWKLEERYICRFVCLYWVYFDRSCPLLNNIVKFLKYFRNISWNISGQKNSWNFTSLVAGHRCHGLPSWQFSARCVFPFSTYGQARDRRTDRQTTTTINALSARPRGGV